MGQISPHALRMWETWALSGQKVRSNMSVLTPTALELRKLLPELALRADKMEILQSLRPFELDIDPCDPDYRIGVRLLNGYSITFTPAGLLNATDLAWTKPQPGAMLGTPGFEEFQRDFPEHAALLSAGVAPEFTAHARLMHEDQSVDVPVRHMTVRSCCPITLVEDALSWFRHETKLPLKYAYAVSNVTNGGAE